MRNHPECIRGPKPPKPANPVKLGRMFTATEALDYHLKAIKGYEDIARGAQWPESLKEFIKPALAEHRFYAWVLKLGVG